MTSLSRFRSRQTLCRGLAVLGTLGAGAILAAPAGAATASTVTSQNWSGYAAHGGSTRFSTVQARWRLPAASCTAGEQSFSSFWVGIGGYSESSVGLEQDGTELDCNANGTQTLHAWYELLPAAPRTIAMTVRSGDVIAAAVHVDGRAVTVSVKDVTRAESFTRTVTDADVDTTSAEWIAEAPSECTGNSESSCSVLPLADFRAVRFARASATTTAGTTRGIRSSRWTTTKLLLGYAKQSSAFIADSTGASATPSALTAAATSFAVTWSEAAAPSSSGTGTTTTTGSGSGTSGDGGSSGSGTSGDGGSSGTGTTGIGGTGSSGLGLGAPNPGGGGDGPGWGTGPGGTPGAPGQNFSPGA